MTAWWAVGEGKITSLRNGVTVHVGTLNHVVKPLSTTRRPSLHLRTS